MNMTKVSLSCDLLEIVLCFKDISLLQYFLVDNFDDFEFESQKDIPVNEFVTEVNDYIQKLLADPEYESNEYHNDDDDDIVVEEAETRHHGNNDSMNEFWKAEPSATVKIELGDELTFDQSL